MRATLWALTVGLVTMVPASYVSYTSLGFDFRQDDGPDWINRMQRIQWPGDGSVRIRSEQVRRPVFEGPIDRWDLAGRLFQPPVRRAARSRWNRAGFWWIDERVSRGTETSRIRSIGVPSWMPPAGLVAVLRRRRAKGVRS